MKFAQLIVFVSLAAGLPACGQKGPLVMPDAQKHKRTIPSLPGAPTRPGEGTTPPPAPSGGSATSPPPPSSAPPPTGAPPPAGAPSPASTPPARGLDVASQP